MPLLAKKRDGEGLDMVTSGGTKWRYDRIICDGTEHRIKLYRTEDIENAHDPEGKPEIANPVDHEGFNRRVIGRFFLKPKTDQQI